MLATTIMPLARQESSAAHRDVEFVEVPASRFAWGQWCHETQKQIGEGDIAKSYSADTIPNGRVRRPFRDKTDLFVCVGKSLKVHRRESAEAYRLLLIDEFDGRPTTYVEITQNAEAARQSLFGFYHGITVQRGGRDHVLCGPPTVFIASDDAEAETQLDLF